MKENNVKHINNNHNRIIQTKIIIIQLIMIIKTYHYDYSD